MASYPCIPNFEITVSLAKKKYILICRLEKYLNLGGFFEKSLKINYALKSTGKFSSTSFSIILSSISEVEFKHLNRDYS